MSDTALILIALIWLAGACLRVYRQARFYQIEEYMSLRYLRWLVAARARWLPSRPVVAWVVGSAFSFILTEAPGGFMLALVGVVSALAASVSPGEGEVKKPFRATPRARRMLGAAFTVCAALMAVGVALVLAVVPSSIAPLRFISVGLVGLVAHLCAPLALVAGNMLMTPVEAVFRQRFIASARRVLNDVHPVVVGITGSYGKTSTKNILAFLLNGRYHAYATPKSYNTLMGVCIAINNDLAGDHSVDYFVAEMGAYVPGEIARLCDLTHPTIGVVVEVGPQHLERFGTLENTATAKYELIKALPPDGVGVFNWDNAQVRAMFERGYPQTRIAVSREVTPDSAPPNGPRLVASDIVETLDGLRFTVTDTETGTSERFETPLLGIHNVTNILLAAAVCLHERMSLREIARRARRLQPAESRLVRQVSASGVTIINDAYSANPAGIVSALRVLSLHDTGRRVLITPGMVELGALMDVENHKLGVIAADHATDVILVGARRTQPIRDGLLSADFPPDRLLVVETLAESMQWVQNNLRSGDAVLYLNDLPDTYTT